MGNDQALRIGAMQMAIRSLDARAADGIEPPFVALLPALDLTRLAATTAIVPKLLEGGCVDIMLAGPRADAYHEQIHLVIEERGGRASSSPFSELGDGCHAALLGALIHKSGVALCLDEPEVLDMLRAAATANGWTVPSSERAAAHDRSRSRRTKPKLTPKKTKGKTKTRAKARK